MNTADVTITADNIAAARGFVRAVGCCPGLDGIIRNMDSRYGNTGQYKRITAFPQLSDSGDISRCTRRYEQIMADKDNDSELSRALKKILLLVSKTDTRYNSTIEKNLAVSLIYWSGLFPCRRGSRFVCSGNIRQREYAFCCLAAFMGADVLLLLPGGDVSLAEELLQLSRTAIIGDPGNMNIPEVSPAARTAGNSCPGREGAPLNLSHPGRTPLHSQHTSRAAGNILTGRRTAADDVSSLRSNVSPGGNTPVNLSRPNRAAAPVNIIHPDCGNTTVNIAPANTPPMEARELTYEQLALLAESVVMIETLDEKGEPTGSGSGVAVGRDGYILTNCHVAGHSGAYRVRLENEDKFYFTDRLIKYHPLNDLAVIRIGRTLKPLQIFNGSRELARGQRVVAIGSPKGLFNSVSDGIISGFRTINDVDMIQFTAPISGGSSGGALLDMYGRIIGICTASLVDAQNINIAVSYKQIMPFCGGFIK